LRPIFTARGTAIAEPGFVTNKEGVNSAETYGHPIEKPIRTGAKGTTISLL